MIRSIMYDNVWGKKEMACAEAMDNGVSICFWRESKSDRFLIPYEHLNDFKTIIEGAIDDCNDNKKQEDSE